jgi:hypothetical protein
MWGFKSRKPLVMLDEHGKKLDTRKKKGKKINNYSVYMYPGLIVLTRIFFGPNSQAIERAI